jgi:4-hydroxy-2-oxoheptanedioate aldolase
VQAAIDDAIKRIIAQGKAAGILTSDRTLARHYLDLGATFVAVGSDVGLLSDASAALFSAFASAAKLAPTGY